MNKHDMEKVIKDLFFGKSYKEMREKGIPYSRQFKDGSWEIFSGETTMRCNDAGKALFDKALQDEIKKLSDGK